LFTFDSLVRPVTPPRSAIARDNHVGDLTSVRRSLHVSALSWWTVSAHLRGCLCAPTRSWCARRTD